MEPKMFSFDSQNKLYSKCLSFIKNTAKQCIEKQGYFTIALSGGNTPKPLYEMMAKKDFYKDIDLNKIHFFIVDERYVEYTNPDSNYGMMKEILFDKISINSENIHPMPVSYEGYKTAALEYEKELKSFFKDKILKNDFPVFDLMILGMGNDGHTASLFPGDTENLNEKHAWVKEVYAPNGKPPGKRLTLTFPVINNADYNVFIIKGSDKKEIFEKVFIDKNITFPAANISANKELIVFTDKK